MKRGLRGHPTLLPLLSPEPYFSLSRSHSMNFGLAILIDDFDKTVCSYRWSFMLWALANPKLAVNARQLGKQLEAEDGVSVAVELIEGVGA